MKRQQSSPDTNDRWGGRGISYFPPQIPTAVLGGSVPDVPGKFDLVRLIDYSVDRVCRRIMAERESFEKGKPDG